jgi:chromosome segregation ATPase
MGLLNKFVRKPKESEDDFDLDIEVAQTDFTSMEFETQEIMPDKKASASYLRSTEVHEIEELRSNVGKMANALRDSMRLSQDTVGDIEKISRFLEVAEANTISVERLRPENTKLKSKLDSVRDEIAKADARVREVETRAEMYKSRLEQSFEELASTRARLIEVEETFRREKSKRSETNQSV